MRIFLLLQKRLHNQKSYDILCIIFNKKNYFIFLADCFNKFEEFVYMERKEV